MMVPAAGVTTTTMASSISCSADIQMVERLLARFTATQEILASVIFFQTRARLPSHRWAAAPAPGPITIKMAILILPYLAKPLQALALRGSTIITGPAGLRSPA